MSQQNRKRQHQQQSPPVKQEEEDAQSNDAGINNSSQCSSSSNAAGGNSGDDTNELKLKMAALEAKNQILEGKLENQELRHRIHSMSEEGILANLKKENRALWMRLNQVEENAKTDCKKMMDEFGQRLTALEAKHQQETAGYPISKKLIRFVKRQQQQKQQLTMTNAEIPDSVVVNMPESQQGTSNNSNEIQHGIVENRQQATMGAAASFTLIPPPPVVPNLAACHSTESDFPGNLNTLDERIQYLESRHRQQTTLAAAAAVIPPLNSIVVNPLEFPCHSAQQQEEDEEDDEVVVVGEIEAKRLCNPLGNSWNPGTGKATMKVTQDGLAVHNTSPTKWGNILARKGFLLSTCRPLLQNNFAGPILYYYEITAKSQLLFNEGRLCFGFSCGTIPKASWFGRTPNTYAMQDHNHKCDFCHLSGAARIFEWPDGVIPIKPMLYGCGDVFGCGLVLSADDKLAIFFTTNGILLGEQFPIVHLGSILYPCVQLNLNVTVEANFGQKPFKYNIDQCPGLQLQW